MLKVRLGSYIVENAKTLKIRLGSYIVESGKLRYG